MQYFSWCNMKQHKVFLLTFVQIHLPKKDELEIKFKHPQRHSSITTHILPLLLASFEVTSVNTFGTRSIWCVQMNPVCRNKTKESQHVAKSEDWTHCTVDVKYSLRGSDHQGQRGACRDLWLMNLYDVWMASRPKLRVYKAQNNLKFESLLLDSSSWRLPVGASLTLSF